MSSRQLWQSQNFLKSTGFVSSLLDKTDINSRDIVVEIGPGKGIITQVLAKRAKKVIGVEYDSKLVERLKKSLANQANIEIIEANFLKWDLPECPYKVFSNIPFNMTADIIDKLLNSSQAPEAIYLIMQDKAAERFIGAPVSQNSQASILLQPFYDMEIVIKINKNQFKPIPNVNVVLAKFVKRKKPLINPGLRQLYRDLVVFGFNQWQPTVLDAFKKIFSRKQINIISQKSGFMGLKPSELTIQQWVILFDSFIRYVPEEKKGIVKGAEQELKLKQREMQKQHRTRNKT